jgi:hypothetical protein
MRVIMLAVVAAGVGLMHPACADAAAEADRSRRETLPLYEKNRCTEIKDTAGQLFCGDPEHHRRHADLQRSHLGDRRPGARRSGSRADRQTEGRGGQGGIRRIRQMGPCPRPKVQPGRQGQCAAGRIVPSEACLADNMSRETAAGGNNFGRSNRRHCERSEAIHLTTERKNGLLRRSAPRNDECCLSKPLRTSDCPSSAPSGRS